MTNIASPTRISSSGQSDVPLTARRTDHDPPLLPERKRKFSQPPLDPICLDVRKIRAVDSRRALVGAALGIGIRQNVVAADLVVQGVEAIAGRRGSAAGAIADAARARR
jgi:hypothetical protein